MKTFFTFCFLSIFLSSFVFANTITGKVKDENGNPLEFCTVALLKAADSSLVKGEITDLNGNFEIAGVPDGEYFIECSYIGFEKNITTKFFTRDLRQPFIITLMPANTKLDELVVKSRKPLIEIQADKMILNTDASISSVGSNGLDLLRKAPGVTVDNNENIQLKGKSGVQIFIDGKPSYLNAQELANLLKGMTAADIEAIEIITNPSARFDAQGNAGIINLKLRKNKNYGTNGSLNVSAGYGRYHKSYASLNLNNRNKKFNTFGSVGIGNNKRWNSLNLYRQQDGKIFDQKQEQINRDSPLNSKIGFDYYANNKHTFGVLANVNTNYRENSWKSVSNTLISSDKDQLKPDSVLQASNNITGNRINLNTNFNYRFTDTLGHELVVDLDRGLFRSVSESFQPNFYKGHEGNLLSERTFANDTPSDIDIYTAKADFNKSYKSGFKWSVGGKFANVTTNNTFLFYDVVDNLNILDKNQSNEFKYTEKVAAVYANVNGKIKSKLTYQLGLRLENTHSIGDLTRDPSIPAKPQDYVNRNYTNLFPSGAITYLMDPNHVFNFTYSRRLNRPNYQDLNPFEWRLDELSFRRGNPYLTPSFSDNVELTYTLLQKTNISIGFSNTDDMITDIVERDMDIPNKSFINYRNLANQKQVTLGINSPLPIKKWWNGFVSLTVYKAYFKARFDEYAFDISTPIATNVYMEHNFSLPKNFALDVSGWFNSASIWGGSWLTEPQGSLDLGVRKIIMKGKANIKVSVTDILLTAPWRSYSEAIPGLIITGSGAWESQRIMVNFNYKFGNNQVKSSRNRKTGLEDEGSRIKA